MTAVGIFFEWIQYWPFFLPTALLLTFASIPKLWANVCAIILMFLQEIYVASWLQEVQKSNRKISPSGLYKPIIAYVIYQAACIVLRFCVDCCNPEHYRLTVINTPDVVSETGLISNKKQTALITTNL